MNNTKEMECFISVKGERIIRGYFLRKRRDKKEEVWLINTTHDIIEVIPKCFETFDEAQYYLKHKNGE